MTSTLGLMDLVLKSGKIRSDFPILSRKVNGKPLIYFDNAASSQMPEQVIQSIADYYRFEHSNVHRGIHTLSEDATGMFEDTRLKITRFFNAAHHSEIIFTGGTTDGINLIAQTWGRFNLKKGDQILISGMEHHSNIVPWQMLCEEKDLELKIIPVTPAGELDLDAYASLLTEKVKLVAVVHTSNALGTVNPVKEMIKAAHQVGALFLVDGAQAAGHSYVDVTDMDADFFVCSGHKMHAATGIGILYGKKSILDSMPPWKGGGDMIKSVTFEKTTYNDTPFRFEAGTPHIVGVKSLGTAIDYIESVGFDRIAATERVLLDTLTSELESIDGIRLIGTAKEKIAVASFVSDTAHPSDIGTLLDMEGIAIRVGHHCTQPLMQHFGLPGTARASLAFYNTVEEIEQFGKSLRKVLTML
jgi:cysteine desulfurase / selenocysteine lyase